MLCEFTRKTQSFDSLIHSDGAVCGFGNWASLDINPASLCSVSRSQEVFRTKDKEASGRGLTLSSHVDQSLNIFM